MERFNLSLWLLDKNRRIVTGDGREVRIVCWDADSIKPIIALVKNKFANGNTIVQYTKYGTVLPDEYTDNDLFFAEEKKLTEFEEAMVSFAYIMFDHLLDKTKEVDIKEWKEKFLDLARKEIEDEADESLFGMFGDVRRYADNDPRLNSVKQGYYLGKRDALKDLPKWKKATEYKKLGYCLCVIHEHVLSFKSELFKGDYYIELEDLKKLPKENPT